GPARRGGGATRAPRAVFRGGRLLDAGSVGAPGVRRLSRRLCRPRHAGGAYCRAFHSCLRSRPKTQSWGGLLVEAPSPPPRRRSLWKRFRRATRGPRNAVLARAIWGTGRAIGMLPPPAALAVGRALGRGAYALLGTPRRLAWKHVGMAFPELDDAAHARIVRATFEHAGQSFAELG